MYEYTPLPRDCYIRLLQLEVREGDQPTLNGSLTLRDLDGDGPEYTTLSYNWGCNSDGDDSLNRTIFIDGSALLISENLYGFLIEASRPDSASAELLWADAICINQGDVQERGAQVSIVGDIYKKSVKLVIWLGHGASEFEDESALQLQGFSVLWVVSGRSATRFLAETREANANISGLPMSGLQKRALTAARNLANRHKIDRFGGSENATWQQHLYRAVADNFSPHRLLRWVCPSHSHTWELTHLSPLFEMATRETSTHYISRTLRNHVCNWLWLCLVCFALSRSRGPQSLTPLIAHLDPLRIHEQLWMTKNTLLIYILGCQFFNDVLAVFILLVEAPVRLSQRRYFARRWIIQEIHHSIEKPILVNWGRFSIPVDELKDLFYKAQTDLGGFDESQSWMDQTIDGNSWLQHLSSNRVFLTNAREVLHLGPHLHWTVWEGKSVGTRRILHYLFRFQHAACSDWRDRIYALMSLVGKGKMPLTADYNLSSRKVFNSFVCACVSEGALDPLLLSAA